MDWLKKTIKNAQPQGHNSSQRGSQSGQGSGNTSQQKHGHPRPLVLPASQGGFGHVSAGGPNLGAGGNSVGGVEVGRFDSGGSPGPSSAFHGGGILSSGAAAGGVCCALGGRTDGSFGDDETGIRIRRLWKTFEKVHKRRDQHGELEHKGSSRLQINEDATSPLTGEEESELDVLVQYVSIFEKRFGAPATLAPSSEAPPANARVENRDIFPASRYDRLRLLSQPPAASNAAFAASGARSRSNVDLSHSPQSFWNYLGHPHVVLLEIFDILADIAGLCSMAKKQALPSDALPSSANTLPRALFLLKHIDTLTQYPGNRDAFVRHGGIDTLTQLIDDWVSPQIATGSAGPASPMSSIHVQQSASFNQNVSSSVKIPFTFPVLAPVVRDCLLVSLTIIQRCADPDFAWENFIRRGGRDATVVPVATPESLPGNQVEGRKGGAVALRVGITKFPEATVRKLVRIAILQLDHQIASTETKIDETMVDNSPIYLQFLQLLGSLCMTYGPLVVDVLLHDTNGVNVLCALVSWARPGIAARPETATRIPEVDGSISKFAAIRTECVQRILACYLIEFLRIVDEGCRKRVEQDVDWPGQLSRGLLRTYLLGRTLATFSLDEEEGSVGQKWSFYDGFLVPDVFKSAQKRQEEGPLWALPLDPCEELPIDDSTYRTTRKWPSASSQHLHLAIVATQYQFNNPDLDVLLYHLETITLNHCHDLWDPHFMGRRQVLGSRRRSSGLNNMLLASARDRGGASASHQQSQQQSHGVGSQGGDRGMLAVRGFLVSLIDVFQRIDDDQMINGSDVQLGALKVISRLLTETIHGSVREDPAGFARRRSWVVRYLDELGLWQMLMRSHFDTRVDGDTLGSNSTLAMDASVQMLRNDIVRLMVHCGTSLSDYHPMDQICQVLLSLLERMPKRSDVIRDVCGALMILLRARRRETQQSLLRIRGTNLLLRAVRATCRINDDCLESPKSANPIHLSPDRKSRRSQNSASGSHEDTRYAIFALLDSFLADNREAAVLTYLDSSCMSILYELVMSKHPSTSRFAQHHILDIGRVLSTDFPTYDACRAAYPEQYDRLISSQGNPPSNVSRSPVPSESSAGGQLSVRTNTTTPFPIAELGRDTMPDFLRRYFECFPSAIDTRDLLALQIRLFQGVTHLVHSVRGEAWGNLKKAMIKAKGFQYILSVLSVKMAFSGDLASPASQFGIEEEPTPGDREQSEPDMPPISPVKDRAMGDIIDSSLREVIDSIPNNFDSTLDEDDFHFLAEEAVDTIATLLRDDAVSKRVFKELQGYEELYVRICVRGGWTCWEGLVNKLFLLLTDGQSVPSRPGRGRVRNSDAVEALFHFMNACEDDLRDKILNDLTDTANASEANKAALHGAGVLTRLLKMVLPLLQTQEHLDDAMSLFMTVASYSMTVAETRLALRCLRSFDATPDRRVLPISTDDHRRRFDRPATLKRSVSVTTSSATPLPGMTWAERRRAGLLEIPESGMQLPAFYDTLLKAIVEVGQKKLYDLNFYAFDGTGGMVFPGPDKWPINGGGGWSFATWVWLDEEPWTSVADQSESTTVQASASGLRTIFGLWMKNGEGSVEIGVINNVLTVLVTRGGNVHTAAVESYVLGTGQWHCIALSHANPKLPWSSTGELTAYINGESRFKGKLEYPESGVYSSARIGCSNKGNSSTRASTVTYAPPTTYSNSFAGQLTSIYLLDDNLNGAQASTINAMGPFRISQFRKRATTANPSSSATLSRTMDATFATLSSFPSSWSMSQSQLWNPPPQAGPPLDVGKIVMQFHPMATRGMEVRNRTGGPLQSGLKKLRLQSDSSTLSPSTPQSVQGDPSDYGTSANSDKMMGVVTCATKCFRTGVHALGGVDILIPLLAQVDLQTQELVTANELDGTQGDPEELAKLKRSRIKLFFDMLAMVLIADIQHQDRFATIGGPKLISALLRQNHALGLGIDILYSIVNLRSLVMAHSQLPFDIAQQLIFEPRIWTRTPPAIQMEYFHYALTFLENNPEVYREKFGASFWIEALERYYRYTAQPSALIPAADASGVVGPESARSSSSPQDSFKLLRRFIIGIIKRLLLRTSSSAINSDIDNLIQVLACSDDSTHVAELLTLILEISIHNPETKFLERFLGQSGAEVLVLILVNRKLERTRILALQIIFMVIISPHVSDRWKKRMKLDDISWLGTSLGGGSASSTSAPGASVLARLLREHPLTTKTYYALLQMALEEQILDWELQEALVVPLEMKGAKIRNRGYLQALLELAANTAGDVPDITKLKSEVVRDLLVIGCRNGNAEVIHKMPRWQGALLDLLESKKSPRLSSVVPPPSVLEPSTQPEEIRKHTNVSLEPLSEELESLEETGDETAAEERDECLSDNQTVTSSTDDQREEPSSSSDVPDVPEIQESPDASAPAASETPSEDLNVLPTQLSDLAGVQPPEDDVRASQTVSLADDTTRLINLVFETLITFTLDTFDSDKKAWRSVEEVAVCAWFLRKGDEAYQLLKTFLLRLMGAIKGEVAGGDWRNFSGARVENIAHTLLFVEEFMFNHHDLRDALMRDVRQEDPRRLAFLPTLTGLLAAPSGAGGQVIRMSFPVGECRDLVEETLDVLSLLIDVGVTHISISDTAEKSHTRSGGLIRLAIRLLLSALTVPEDAVWNLALRHLIPILDKHAMTFSENRPKERGFYILAHIHSIFSVAQARALKAKDVLRPDYRILIPLYMLVVTRWRDSVNSISSTTSDAGDGVIFSDKLLNEALADQQIFLHMITSPVWSGAFDSYFWPTMKAVEEEDFAMVPLATRRFARTVHATHVRWAKEEAAMDKCREHVCGQLDRVARKRREDEATHCAEREKDEELDKRAVTRQTCFLWRTLTQERGIWSIVDAVGDSYGDDVRWKLDRAENHLRMRKRLAPNWEFDDHANAAAKRDRTFKPDVANTGSLSRTASSNAIAMTAADRKSQMDRLKMQVESGMGVAPGLLKEISLLSLGVSPGEDATELGDEEWSVLNEDDLQSSSQAANSTTLSRSGPRVLYAEDCELILLMTAVKGRLELTPTHLTFTADIKATTANLAEADREAVMVLLVDNDALLKERRWALQDLYDCYLRRYMLRKSAVELFFTDKTNYLFNFLGPSKVANKERLRFVKYLINCKPSQLNAVDLRSNPIEIVKKMGVTDMWARREISNFEYLMWLNTVSGRTYNDLTQYPVFPWVITDYTSPKLDLKDPSIYRDLSKPIGALDERRLEQFAERYSAFEDPNGQIKKFHYGTHYSSAAATLFYLLRVEPYTTLHIALQAGKFDHPDRQFHSMQSCWNSVLKGNGDVKELIPEFYYMPEFLCNENKFDLGTKQTGERLDNVILPPWAETAEDFVRIHREALESDHVSENLHQWIDLIWGYKQTGEEAVKAFNVFYYLTYEGAINIDAIKDPIERRSIEDQINNFGQTPSQLFKKPHPRRQPRNPDRTTLFDAPDDHRSYLIETKGTEIQFNWACVDDLVDANGLTGTDRVPHGLHHGSRSVSSPALPAWTGFEGKRVITVDGDMCFRAHKWNGGAEIPFTFETDNTALRKRKIPFQLASTTHPHSQLFSATHDGRFLIAGGCWDASLHVLHLEGHHGHGSPRIVDVVTGHRDIVTCIAIGEDDKTVVSGSMDTTVIAWELDAGTGIIRKNGGEVFCGHDDWVTAVAVNVEHGLVVSGSKDGTVILHVLQGAKYLRTLRPAAPSQQTEILSIHRILITTSATIIIHTESSVPPTSTTSSSSTASPTSEQQAGSTSLATTDSTTTTTTTTTQLGYLHAYTLNGKWIQSRLFTTRLNDVKASRDGKDLVAVDSRGGIVLMKTHNLHITHRFDVSIGILSVSISTDQRYLFLGRVDGTLLVIAHEPR